MDENNLSVEMVHVSSIKRYENNPRINAEAVAKVAASISQFGWRQPIVVDRDGVIVAGDTRYQAALKLGLTEIPVHRAAELTPAQAAAYRLADNRVSEFSSWDYGKLLEELRQLEQESESLDLTSLGFSEVELAGAKLPVSEGPTDPLSEWVGMPEYHNESSWVFRLVINFSSQEAVSEFASLLGQPITESTKSLWFPEKKPTPREEKWSD